MSPRNAIVLMALLFVWLALPPTQSRSADTPAAKLVIVKA